MGSRDCAGLSPRRRRRAAPRSPLAGASPCADRLVRLPDRSQKPRWTYLRPPRSRRSRCAADDDLRGVSPAATLPASSSAAASSADSAGWLAGLRSGLLILGNDINHRVCDASVTAVGALSVLAPMPRTPLIGWAGPLSAGPVSDSAVTGAPAGSAATFLRPASGSSWLAITPPDARQAFLAARLRPSSQRACRPLGPHLTPAHVRSWVHRGRRWRTSCSAGCPSASRTGLYVRLFNGVLGMRGLVGFDIKLLYGAYCALSRSLAPALGRAAEACETDVVSGTLPRSSAGPVHSEPARRGGRSTSTCCRDLSRRALLPSRLDAPGVEAVSSITQLT